MVIIISLFYNILATLLIKELVLARSDMVLITPCIDTKDILYSYTHCPLSQLISTIKTPIVIHYQARSLTQTLFPGCNLRISYTTTKIAKRALWDEKIEKVAFYQHRLYNLTGARVILLPKGLVRRRYCHFVFFLFKTIFLF